MIVEVMDEFPHETHESTDADRVRFLTLLLNAVEQAVMATDADGRITYWNRHAERLYGWTAEEVLGRNVLEVTPPPNNREIAREIMERLTAGERWSGEFEVRRRDGSTFIAAVTDSPILDEAGRIVGVVGTSRDVTAEKAVEAERARLLEVQRAARAAAERRAEEEAALRDAVAAVTAAITVEEAIRQIARGAFQATNADFALVERVDPERDTIRVVALAGRSEPKMGEAIRFSGSLAEQAIQHGEAITIDDMSASPSAPPHLRQTFPNCSAAIVPMADERGVVGALILLRPRAQGPFEPGEVERARIFANLALLAFRKVEMLEASEAQRRELERAMEGRARLVRGFSHDVKNPLGAADGYAQLLETGVHGPLQSAQLDAVSRIRGTLRAALELIDRTVELARAETGQLRVERQPVHMGELVRLVTEEYQARARAEQIALDRRVADGLPVIRSDPNRIRQILGNLLSNAVKHTPEGGRVLVAAERRSDGGAPGAGAWIAIAVKDTGPGVPEALRESIFEEFVRGPARDHSGAGLGLAISKRLAKLLGAELTLETATGKGSTFTLWLPVSSD